ncbi:MAG: hypothetical protein GWO16_08560, partial [Gammaproteobacteria bacterium]|nr:hypothetical protein [Gammaproteobacteria bacterium]NIT63692.1 hypothetical protein [Gammaproteobacteria bacterium]NIV20619.1 hypothetical protein [Gammaproteobacteria bacterium]NIY32272.1 hypothetical protein [Gammaproteobacteria bacterium]
MNGRCTHLIPALALAASLLLGWAAPVAAQQAAAEQVEVRVLPRSEVTGAQYTLGEVAELDGFDLEPVRRLAAVALGRSPRP